MVWTECLGSLTPTSHQPTVLVLPVNVHAAVVWGVDAPKVLGPLPSPHLSHVFLDPLFRHVRDCVDAHLSKCTLELLLTLDHGNDAAVHLLIELLLQLCVALPQLLSDVLVSLLSQGGLHLLSLLLQTLWVLVLQGSSPLCFELGQPDLLLQLCLGLHLLVDALLAQH